MERGTSHIFSSFRTERRLLTRKQCLACINILTQFPKFFGDYLFSSHTFDNCPRDRWAYFKLVRLNLSAAMATIFGGICLYELSHKELAQAMYRSAVFPLYLPHAIGLAIACKYQGSVAVGNFLGYYFSRLYLVMRGPPDIYLSRALIIIMIALLGVLETHIGAWLMRRYLCRRENLVKKVPTIDNVTQAFFYISIILVTTLLFDTLIAVVACLSEIVPWNFFLRFWATWWLGVVSGMLTLSPAIIHSLAVGLPRFVLKRPNYFNLVKSVVLWLVVVGMLVLLFFFSIQSFVRPLPYLVFPLIIFASFRFNRVGWAIVVAFISLCCSWGTLHRNSSLYYMAGAPADKSSPSLILQIELFVSVMGLVGIVLAAAVKEKIQLTNDLNKVNEDLEETVTTRTKELLKANHDLQISQKRAEHASHAKSDFLANMSHEIRTPIHGILGLTALLLESQLTTDQRESLMSVKECADLLLHIINSVLDLSKIEAGRLEVETVTFSIRKTISSTLRMMQARAHAHNLQLLWHIDGAVPDSVVGDPGKLQQCLLNLVGNALKFTNEGSVTVHVNTSARTVRYSPTSHLECEDNQSMTVPKVEVPSLFPRPPKPPSRLAKLRSWASWPGPYFRTESGKSQSCTIDVHESSDSDGSYNTKIAPVGVLDAEICSQPSTPETVDVEFEVQDTGIGISKEKLNDMFHPFTQADASTSRLYGGTGLGLCIVQRFVELLGGKIWAQSEVNKGSTFGFRIPFRTSSDPDFMHKAQNNRGPLRFSSLEAPNSHRPKNGLKRRAYSLDVLMRSMKFNLPSLVEGNDEEESVSSKGSGDRDSRGCSLRRAVEEATSRVLDTDAGSAKPSNESLVSLSGMQAIMPISFLPGDLEATVGSLVRSDLGAGNLARLTTRDAAGDFRSNPLREGVPPVELKGKLHKFEKSYDGSKSKSSEEKRLKLPKPASSSEESSTDGLEIRMHSTVITVDDRIEETTGEQLVKNVSVPDRVIPGPSVSSLPVELSLQLETSVASSRKFLTSELKGAKGFRKPGLDDGERPLHILLAEDNPINQKVASRQLQRYGHKVSIVGDGKQALDAVEASHEAYDLVLMDVQMPNMDGLQATESIRDLETQRNWGRLPILGLTAHAIQGYQETCISHGMDGYLGKPFEIKQLLKQMHELVSTNVGPRHHGR